MTDGIPDMGQIVRMIPGLAVTTVGGVVTSMLPGKIKIAGMPIVGYGLYMMLIELVPRKEIDITPWTPPNVNIGDAFNIVTRLVNTGNVGIDYNFILDITNPDGGFFRSYSGSGFLGAQWANNTIDITSSVDAGWDGPEGVYIGNARVYDTSTDPPTLLMEYGGSIFTAGGVPPEKQVNITPWTPIDVNIGDATDIVTKLTNVGSETVVYSFIFDITDSTGAWFRSYSGHGYINAGQSIDITSNIDTGWTGPEGIYTGHARVYDTTTDPPTLVGEYEGDVLNAGYGATPERDKLLGYIEENFGSDATGCLVHLDLNSDGVIDVLDLSAAGLMTESEAKAVNDAYEACLSGQVSANISGFDVNGV